MKLPFSFKSYWQLVIKGGQSSIVFKLLQKLADINTADTFKTSANLILRFYFCLHIWKIFGKIAKRKLFLPSNKQAYFCYSIFRMNNNAMISFRNIKSCLLSRSKS